MQKKTIGHIHGATNGRLPWQSDQNTRAEQLCDPKFTIYKFMMTTHIWGNFIDQIRFFPELLGDMYNCAFFF
jgi:hypothetical protein